MIDPHELLHCPMQQNDADAATVGEYLGLLLSTLWLREESFDSKRPFGNSGWKWEVYTAMVRGGLAAGIIDDEGDLDDFFAEEEFKADELIMQAIRFWNGSTCCCDGRSKGSC